MGLRAPAAGHAGAQPGRGDHQTGWRSPTAPTSLQAVFRGLGQPGCPHAQEIGATCPGRESLVGTSGKSIPAAKTPSRCLFFRLMNMYLMNSRNANRNPKSIFY